MGKTLLFGVMLFLAPLLFLPCARAQDLELVLGDFYCLEGKYIVKFGVVNSYTFQREPTIGLKIIDGDKVVACEEITLSVPPGSDGTVIHEVTFSGPCSGGEFTLESRIVDQTVRNRIGPWLSGCPE